MLSMFNLVLVLALLAAATPSPLMGALILTAAALILGGLVGFYASVWLGYSIILMFVGGLMILFLYVCAFSTSSKFFNPVDWKWNVLILIAAFSFGAKFQSSTSLSPSLSISSLYQQGSAAWISILILSLLIILFICVVLCTSDKGPLKSKLDSK